MTIQIPVSAAIARYEYLCERMLQVPADQVSDIIADRHKLLLAIAAKAGIPAKKGWRVRVLEWMDEQMKEKVTT
jgi:hypothetical protein